MKKEVVIGIIVVALILVVGVVGSYNSLVSKQTAVEEQEANLDAQLQRRADLIPNLVKTVKSFSVHEKEVFAEVNKARENLMSAGTMAEKTEANEQMTGALNRLIAIAESYPEIKSDKVYVDLMDELAGTENRIARSREKYNQSVASYNRAIRAFPGAIFANMFGFERAELFEAESSSRKAPEVDL